MSPAQNSYYWRLWSMARKADPELDRKELHKALDLPESHTKFQQHHFDAFKSRCLALAQPANYREQANVVVMPRTRRLWLAETLCTALHQEAEYALAILRRMNKEGALGRAELSLPDLTEEELDKVLTALRKACRRLWPTKPELLRAIVDYCLANEIDESAARQVTAEALHLPAAPDLEGLHYDRLLVVLAALRALSKVEDPF